MNLHACLEDVEYSRLKMGRCEVLSQDSNRTAVYCGMACRSRHIHRFRKNLLPQIRFRKMTFLAWWRIMQVRPKKWCLATTLHSDAFQWVKMLGWREILIRIKLCSLFPQFMIQSLDYHLGFCFSLRPPIIERRRLGRSTTESNHLQRATNTRGAWSEQTQINRNVANASPSPTVGSSLEKCNGDVEKENVQFRCQFKHC
jgi:hypothetical protein